MESKYSDKQEQILAAAERLFAEHGFNGTSVRDIATAAHVNVAMISYYFGSKEKLLEAIFDFRISASTIQLESLVARKDLDPFGKIDLIINHYTDKFKNNTNFFKLMLSEQLRLHEDAALMEVIYNSKKKNFDLFSALIEEGQKSKHFKKDADVSLMLSTLVGAANQINLSRHYYKRLNGLEDMSDEQFEQLLDKRVKTYFKNIFKAILSYES